MASFRSHSLKIRVLGVLVWGTLLASTLKAETALASGGYWQGVASQVNAELHQALILYQGGDAEGARRQVTQAYFGAFEGSKMEAAMRIEQGAKYTYLVERQFGALRKAIKQGVGIDEVQGDIEGLMASLVRDAKVLDAAQIPPEVFQTGQ